MDLRTFRKQRKLTLDEFGRALKVSGVTVHRWEMGKAIPSLRQAMAIEEMSKGKVRAADFLLQPTEA